MTLPRIFLQNLAAPTENLVIQLSAEQARHLSALRISCGDAIEAFGPLGTWRAELASRAKNGASIRLVAPIDENREAPVKISACLPITAQLGLWDDFLPAAVELGATHIQPVVYERSQYSRLKVSGRMGRWRRIICAACEQSHRTRIPDLLPPMPAESLCSYETEQRWVAYEVETDEPNPRLRLEDIAFTHGPEGGVTDAEILMLRESGWKPISLGKSILRAATCPAAILGAIQIELGRMRA